MQAKLHRSHLKALLCALVLALNLPALAAGNGQPSSGLASAFEQAWQLHPQATALDARTAQARAGQELARALTPEPASVSLGHLSDRPSRNLGGREWEVELAVPLWLPGQKDARGAEADSRVAEAAARRAALRLELAGELRDAWSALTVARSAEALAQRRLETARALDADVQKRFKAGELARIDANLAQGEVLAAQAETVESQAALLRAEQAFRLLTGSAAPAELGEEMAAAVADSPDAVLPAHPEFVAAAAAARSAQARLKLAQDTRRTPPELSVRWLRERGDFTESYRNSVGVRLKIAFSSGPQVRSDSSAALAEAQQADAGLRRAEIRLQQEIERGRASLAAAQRQLATAQSRRALSADNLQLAEKSFALGQADLATLLRVRAAAIEAESAHERQRLARAQAISRLNQALGVLP